MCLSWDATYKGQPLSAAAWTAHLEMLRRLSEGRAPDLMALDWPGHQAWVAIGQAGLVRDRTVYGQAFRWAEWELTDLGRTYLTQRR